jgi:hypothetical protein
VEKRHIKRIERKIAKMKTRDYRDQKEILQELKRDKLITRKDHFPQAFYL